MLLGNLKATRHNNQQATTYQKPTHVSHAASHAVQSFTLYIYCIQPTPHI